MIVVDTNIIAYFVIHGEQTPVAKKVFAMDPDWRPEIVEVGNAERSNTTLRQNLMTLDEAIIRISEAEQLISGREYDVDSHRVIELANASGCTAYDCEFASLAQRLNVPLVTAHKKLLSAFTDIAVSMEKFTGKLRKRQGSVLTGSL